MSDETQYISHSVAETEQIAVELARKLVGGECLALRGEMGAGKTQFMHGLIKGLGGAERSVSSPTFVLLNVYDTGRLKVFHLDAYRVTGPEDFESIGFPELLEQGGVVAVEWPERIEELIPKNSLAISIDPISENSRRIRISSNFHTKAQF